VDEYKPLVDGVMGASAATFVFWSTIGTKLFPSVLATAAAAGCAACPGGVVAAGTGDECPTRPSYPHFLNQMASHDVACIVGLVDDVADNNHHVIIHI